MAGGDHGLYTRRCQVEDRWLSFRGRIEIFISILPEDLKVFRYTHEEKLTLPKFGIALKSLSAFEGQSVWGVGSGREPTTPTS